MSEAAPTPPAPFLLAHLEALRRAQTLGPVVDLACGRGRNTLGLAEAGIPCVGIDRSAAHLQELSQSAKKLRLPVALLRCDLETPMGVPLRPESCGALLVFRFLYRPLAPALVESLRPGGLLLYETFHEDHRTSRRGPGNPAFYLGSGELPSLFSGLEVLEYEEGLNAEPRPSTTARLLARKPVL